MNETIDARLLDAGIAPQDVQTRLDGRDKVFVITARELAYADAEGVKRASLREVSKVASGKTGALSVTSPSGTLIEASVRGFDVTDLKVFFDAVKIAIARAKGAPADSERSAATTAVMPGVGPLDAASAAPSHAAASEPRDESPVPANDPREEARPSAALEPEAALERPDVVPAAGPTPAQDPWAEPVPLDDATWSDPAPSAPEAAAPNEGPAWSGERLEDGALLEPGLPRNPTLAPAGAGLDGIGRWLRVAAFLAGLVGVAGAALAAQRSATPALADYVVVAAWVVGGLTAALLAYAVGEVARTLGRAAADLQSVRRATLGR